MDMKKLLLEDNLSTAKNKSSTSNITKETERCDVNNTYTASFTSVTESVPQFTSSYLMKILGKPLIEALRETIIRKPSDPIEFLGHWLLHYKDCEERREKQREFEDELLYYRNELNLLVAEDEKSSSFSLEKNMNEDHIEYA